MPTESLSDPGTGPAWLLCRGFRVTAPHRFRQREEQGPGTGSEREARELLKTFFSSFLKHGKQIFYVTLVRNKILSSALFARPVFGYDTMWYHVFNENFYLEL